MPFSVEDLGRYRLILDTGPLLDFLFHRCIREYRFVNLARHLHVIRDLASADRFGRYLSYHSHVLVSDGVLLELERHRQSVNLELDPFWRVTRGELLTRGFEEAPLRFRALPEDDLYRFGLVDANLLQLACAPQARPAAIVTADWRLYQECLGRSIHPHTVQEILSVEF